MYVCPCTRGGRQFFFWRLFCGYFSPLSQCVRVCVVSPFFFSHYGSWIMFFRTTADFVVFFLAPTDALDGTQNRATSERIILVEANPFHVLAFPPPPSPQVEV